MTSITSTSETEKPKGQPLRILGIAIWISLAVGLFVSGYLSYTKATETHIVCVVGEIFNCDAVTNSAYSRFMGIPIAYLGFGMYLTLTVIYFLEKRSAFFAEYSRLLMFSIGLFAWLFSMWLVYVQFVLLGTLCPWCLSHETNMTILFGMLCYRLWRDMNAPAEA
jgi:uncharacterized membrane protein